MNVSCSHCNAKHFSSEKISNRGNSFHNCCNHGAVYLEPFPQFPQFLRSLFNGSHAKSNNFFKHIRRSYNSLFSFTSFNVNLVNFENRRPGPYCFKIYGQIYSINYHLNENSDLDFEIIQNPEHIMRELNVFAQFYQMMSEELENQQQLEIESGEFGVCIKVFPLRYKKKDMDRCRYNVQRTNEVAIAFIYSLFYSYDTQGWHCNLTKLNNNKQITRGQYIKYRMAIRNKFNVFLLGLFQQ
ncbi:hypothetical protein ACFW04_011319 [Cataglyphis niger]